MKESDVDTLEHKLRERLLLARAVPGDRLMLDDATLLAALNGSKPLSAGQAQALQESPVTLRRFRHLALAQRRASRTPAANDALWQGSSGMLRAAAAGALNELYTDDGCWSLHFLAQGDGWQLILKLEAGAAFAPQLMREQPLLRVIDGGGAILLQGRLDADGECEREWPFTADPVEHLQQHGAAFSVEPWAS